MGNIPLSVPPPLLPIHWWKKTVFKGNHSQLLVVWASQVWLIYLQHSCTGQCGVQGVKPQKTGQQGCQTEAKVARGQPPKFRLTSSQCGQKPPGTVPSWHSRSGCRGCACAVLHVLQPPGTRGNTAGKRCPRAPEDWPWRRGRILVAVLCGWDRSFWVCVESNCREGLAQLMKELLVLVTLPCLCKYTLLCLPSHQQR